MEKYYRVIAYTPYFKIMNFVKNHEEDTNDKV